MDTLVNLIPGFISYILLRPFGLFNFQSDTDRQITLIILSLINSGISVVLTKSLKLNGMLSLIITALFITVLCAFIVWGYNKISQSIADKLNANLYDNMGTMEHSLSQNFKGKTQLLISFDFKNNYIVSGQVKNIDDQGNQQVELYGDNEREYTIKEARSLYKQNKENSIIVDYKNKVKSYVIILDLLTEAEALELVLKKYLL